MERWRKLTRNQQIGIMAAALVLIIVGALLIFGGDDDLQGTAGIQDRDNDTVADESDRCPDDAGDPNLAGCPDGDSDGVPDIDDACPADPNDAVGDPCNHDEDGDGVLDVDDACPNLANDGIGDPCNPDDNVVPTDVPTEVPTEVVPTEAPTEEVVPTEVPTEEAVPTEAPTEVATEVATEVPTEVPTEPAPTEVAALPTEVPTEEGGQAGATINVGFEASIGVDGAVTFTNTSSGDTFAGFSWNFGDGSAGSTETSPIHTYLNAGTYTVTLTATTSDGRSLAATSDVVLTEEQLPPISCAFNIVVVGQSGPPYTLPLEVQFVNNSQNVASYLWTFEDNSTSTDANPANRTYSVAGSYPIKLDCISPRGNLVANGTVNATQSGGGSQTFRAGFTASPGSGEAPLTVQFTDTSVGAVSWAWDFGDGSPVSNDQNPTHQYTTVGVFNVTLTVSNGTLTAVATGSIETVTALARPIADFSVTPQEGNAPLTVTITANVTGGEVTTYEWNFGNGQTSNQAGPHTITYDTAGTYTISLTVNGPGGGSNRTKQVLVTTLGERVAAIFSYRLGDTTPDGKQVCFDNASTGTITSYEWNFGDGSPVSNEQAPCHVYASDGSYTVTLKVVGDDNTSSTASQTVPVISGDVAPIASFTAIPLTARVGDTITFTDTSTGVITDWEWDFGDGNTSTDRNPTHVYASNGTFIVTLRVTGPGGTSEAAQASITVELQPITCDFSGTTSPLLLQTVTYSGSVSNRQGRTVTTYRWTIDGNEVASTQNLSSYQWMTSGAFQVTFYAQTADGAECSKTKTVTVNTASFTCSVTAPSGLLLGQASLLDGVVNNVGGRTVTYIWTVNGAEVATSEDYSFVQTTAGPYTVTFVATIDGVSCSAVTKTITVSGNGIDTCKISSGSGSLLLNQSSGYNSSVNNPANQTLTYTWRLVGPAGSGIDLTSTTQNFANYQFTLPGTYTLTLTITPTNGTGCSATKTITVSQNELTCKIDQGAGTITVGGNSNYRVTASGNVTGVTYAWSNGVTTRTANYVFDTSGQQTVSVTVSATNSAGVTVTCSASKTVTVNPVNTDISCDWSGPRLVMLNATANYSGSVNNLNAVPDRTATYRWLVNGQEVGTDINLAYQFAAVGNFTVRFEATASDGKTCAKQRTVEIKEQSLAANANPNAGIAPLTVSFTGISTNIYPDSYVWDFPGGGHAYTKDTTFRFTVPGEYTIVLHGNGDLGAMEATVIVRVGSATNIRAEFTPSRWNGVAPMEVCYTDQSQGDQINSWEWDLDGDGNTDSTAQNPCFTYTTIGTFDVTLKVKNVFGLEASATNRIRTYGLSESDSSFGIEVKPGGEVCFTSYLSAGTTLTSWDFGDGSTSTDLNPCHTYTESKEYTVTMLVNAQGIPGAIVRKVNVNVSTSLELPNLRVEGVCKEDGSATFTIYNEGGAMPNTDTYRITDASGNTVRSGDFQLGEDESLPITVNARGVLNFSTTDSKLSASTECRKPTNLKAEGVCLEDGSGAQFMVTNVDGGPMDGPMSYTISGGSLATPITGSFQLDGDQNNTFSIDVPDGYGEVTFEATDGKITLTAKTDCVEAPDITVEGRCKEEEGFSGTYFLLVNNGGAMVQPASYNVTDEGGNIVNEGTFLLAEAGAPNFANTLEVFLPGLYGNLTFNAPDLELTAGSECAQPPKIEASGVCSANDLTSSTVVFTITNTGGVMPTSFNYSIDDSRNQNIENGTFQLGTNESTTLTVTIPAGYESAILTVRDGNTLVVSASTGECLPPILPFRVISVCNDDWLNTRVWDVTNPNPFPVNYRYTVDGSTEIGSNTIEANSTQRITTTAVAGSNTLRVHVSVPVGVIELASASSAGPCDAALSVKAVCAEDGSATFVITNTGYPMLAAQPYYVVNIMTEVQNGTVPALGRNESFTVTVPGWYDSLTLRTGYSTPDAQGQGGLFAETTTECAQPPKLTYEAVCLENGHAQFTITNEGGDMPEPSTYYVTDSSNTEVDSGEVNLEAGESQTVEITDTFGTLTLRVDDFEGSITTTCYEPPTLTYEGVCLENGEARFTVTNTGGDMSLGNQSLLYWVFDSEGNEVASGIITLGNNQTLQIPVVGTYGPLELWIDGQEGAVANTECYNPPSLSAVGICKVNGSAEYIVTNTGGDMNLGNQTIDYAVLDNSDVAAVSGTLALGEGESTTILVEGRFGHLRLVLENETVLVETNCQPLPELTVEGYCKEDGSATFYIYNGGGAMDEQRAQTYTITDSEGNEVASGTIQLLNRQSLKVDVTDVYGPLTFTSEGLSPLTANTECYKPPALVGEATCVEGGVTQFVITNNGGDMSLGNQQVEYIISWVQAIIGEDFAISATGVIETGTLELGEGESQTFTVADYFGEIFFDTVSEGGPHLHISSLCYQPPALTASGVCLENGSARFTVANSGGDMRLGNQQQPFTVTDLEGDEVLKGTLELGEGSSIDIPVDGVYGPLTFTSEGLSPVTANTECYKPPVLSAVGTCVENGSALFVIYNGGGDMTSGNQQQTYQITDENGNVVLDGTLEIAENESVNIPVPDVWGTLTFTSEGLSTVFVETTCYQPPALSVIGFCKEDGSAQFGITNNGGDMSEGNQQVDYVIKNEFGQIFERGTLDLDAGASQDFFINRPGETVIFETADLSATAQTYCDTPGDVPPSTPDEPEPVCGYTLETTNGFPVVVMTNPELCSNEQGEREWTPIEVGPAVCPDWLLYHTNQTGDWEVFRLGDLPDNPDADENLSKGVGFRIYDMAPTKSPDAQWIAFASNRDGNWEIYIGSVDGLIQQRVTNTPNAIDIDPMWSPDGQYIVYESARDGNWELYMVDVATGVETRLTDDAANDINAFWHPDGSKLIFQSDREGGLWQIYELTIATGEVVKLSDGAGYDHDASYSFNGEKIVFRSYRDGSDTSAVYVMNADGTDVQLISDVAGDATNPVFSPDDSVVAYQSDVDGDLDIYVYEFSSGITRLLTDNVIPDYAPTWYCESTTIVWTSDITEDPNIFSTNALPIDAPAIKVEEEASQLTFDPNADQYPQNAPSEENASRQRSLPSAEK
ncbi:MAG: hypothetical protein DPW16_09810 [Chloroflexi bacterium]|nr:hypothetical protein [Chloroflexota bacterium]